MQDEEAPDGHAAFEPTAQDIRKARTIVRTALSRAAILLENRGLKHRALPGIWNAAVNVIIHSFDPAEALAFFGDAMQDVGDGGDNADSPLRVVSDSHMDAWKKEVSDAGQAFMECIEKADEDLEEEGLDDLLPKAVFDCALMVVLPAWGGHHVRRAISEQCALIIEGDMRPANFMEPLHLIQRAREDRHEPAAHESFATPPPPEVQPAAAPSGSRSFEAYVFTDHDAVGARSAYAVWVRSYEDDGHEEDRLIKGEVPDTNGRKALFAAAGRLVAAACGGVGKATGRVLYSNEEFGRLVHGEPGSRTRHEEEPWAAVDASLEGHEVTFQFSSSGLSGRGAELCERAVRELLSRPPSR